LSLSPFWGTDIGGFNLSTNRGEYTGELYTRWFQFGTFTPSFRSHGRNWWLHRPWGWNTGEVGPIESRPLPDPSELHNAEGEPTTIKIFPGADGDFTLYDDDGETLGYLGGSDSKAIWIHFKWSDSGRTLTIEPDKRMKKWPGAPRKFNVRLAGVQSEPVEIQF